MISSSHKSETNSWINMKTLVIISALVACCTATHNWGYSAIDAGIWGSNLVSPNIVAPSPLWASRAVAAPYYSTYTAGPSYIASAPAAVVARTYAAPYVAAAPAPIVAAAPAPIVAAAPAPVVAAAPAVVATKTVVSAPVVAAAPAIVAPAVTKTQYHSQDELGQATYGHSEPLQAHNAVQDAHGNKVGSFSYLNPHDGQIHRTDYVADAHGYRVAANDLPIDTPEVALAKAAHLTAHAAARTRRSVVAYAQTPASTAPLATHVVAAPAVYAPAPLLATRSSWLAAAPAPLLAAAPAPVYAPSAYAAPAPVYAASAYAAPAVAPIAPVALPSHRAATLTTVVNNPGHAVSYRVD